MSASGTRTLAQGRLEGLDGWRAGLMIGGVLLHAASWLDPRPLFEAVTLLSHTFRMGAFFAISGFLAARALASRPPGRWLGRRLIQLGFPALFGLAVLCPLTTMMVAAMPGQRPRLPFNWYHLWFLVALLLYAPLTVAVERVVRRRDRWAPLLRLYGNRAPTPASLLAATGMVSLLFILVASIVIGGVGTADTMPLLAGWRSIACYWPDYLLGFMIARSATIQAAMLREWRYPATTLALVALAYAVWFLLLGPRVSAEARLWGDGMLPLIGEAFAPPAVFAFILKSSAGVTRIGTTLRALANASFTIYVVHVPVIAGLTLLAIGTPAAPELKYGLIAAVTLALTFAFHHWIVRRSAWLSLLFCGKPLPERRGLRRPAAFEPAGLALETATVRRGPSVP